MDELKIGIGLLESMTASVNIVVGSHVWVEDPVDEWIDGEVSRINGLEVHVHTTKGKTVVANKSKVFQRILDFHLKV